MYTPWGALGAFEMRISGTTVTIQSISGYNTIGNAAGIYTIAFPLHPAGASSNFSPIVTTRTGTDTGNYYYATCKFSTATSTESKVTVYIRNTATTAALVDGDFSVYTVP